VATHVRTASVRPMPLPPPAPMPAVGGPTSVLQVMPRLLSGLTLCGVGIAMLIRADLGLGPWDVLHQGLSVTTGISIGLASILVGFVVLLLWFPLRERPGVGTITNIIMIGLVIDATLAVTTTPSELWSRWVLLVLSTPTFAIGVGLYIGAGVGSGPRDGVMTGLHRLGVPIAVARATLELGALWLGWTLGGTVGVGTVYFAVSAGPLMQLTLPRLRAPWYPPGAHPRVLGGTPR
jgi:uncharacterized membrane protein YczE